MCNGSIPQMLRTYEGHQLSRASILDRILRQRSDSHAVTEVDLAFDHVDEITDQNHVGGARATIRFRP